MKAYTIRETRTTFRGDVRTLDRTGTLPELIKAFDYVLYAGWSWSLKGGKRVNREPKTIGSLLTSLNNAEDNIAANGCPSTWYGLA